MNWEELAEILCIIIGIAGALTAAMVISVLAVRSLKDLNLS